MSRKLLLFLCIVLVSASLMLLFSYPGIIRGRPVHNLDTGLSYVSIQEAINAKETFDGQTITIDPGIYHEHITANKSLTLLGTGATIDGDHVGTVVYVAFTRDVRIVGLTVVNGGSGGNLEGSNDSGIRVFLCSNCSIIDSVVENCHNGIMSASSNSLIAGNKLTRNKTGILPLDCTNSTICGNKISSNEYGIFLLNCNNSTICDNILEGNDHGIDLYGSDDDFVKQNDFVENTVQARVQISGNNQWDDGSHGNYWSDYNGTDEDHNGVGNNPYIIDENNTDRCPSMTPYWG